MADERGSFLISKYRVDILYVLFCGDWKSHYILLGQSMFWGNQSGDNLQGELEEGEISQGD